MMNAAIFLLFLVWVPKNAFAQTMPSSTSSQCCPYGNLSVKGKHLTNESGTVQLLGMSLFWSQWEQGSKFFNEETVKCLRCSWHADIVRAPLAVDQDGYLSNQEKEYAKVEAVVNAAIKNCIGLVPVIHQSSYSITVPNIPYHQPICRLWYVLIDWHYSDSTEYRDQAVQFFSRISQLCSGKCNCLYETWNEPKQNDWSSQLKPYHEAAIRQNDQNGVIIVATPNYDQDVQLVINDPIRQSNIMYSLHFYAASHKQELRDKAQQAIDKEMPLFVTEYGTTSYTGDGAPDLGETQKWYDFLNNNSISYINWAISDKQEASAALQNPSVPSDVCSATRLTQSGQFVHDALIKRNAATPKGC